MVSPIGTSMASWLVFGLGLHAVSASPFLSQPQPADSLYRRQFSHGEHPLGFNYDWVDITPSRDLEWHDCYDAFKCARLIVPMDYAECGSNQTVALAITMLPAQNTTGDYLGPLFYNPGGPGGSGVELLLMESERLLSYFGDSHDIISWDTRGTWRSTPKVSCFATNQRRHMWRTSWEPDTDDYRFDDPAALAQTIQKHRYEHAHCRSMHGESSILQHISSEYHARDMDSILTAMGRDKLRYYGFSYGTAIAVHYATIFPHKVERMLSEANVDVRANFEGDFFASLGDAKKTRDYVYERCAADSHCPFKETTPDAVGRRIDALLDELRFRPRLQYNLYWPQLYTDAAARVELDGLFRTAIMLGDTFMVQLARHEGSGFSESSESEALDAPNAWHMATDDSPADINNPDYRTTFDDMFNVAISNEEMLTGCADRAEVDLDPERLIEQYKKGRELTPATLWPLTWGTTCAGSTRPKKRFEGPFGGDPAYPILFVNAWDTTTPMRAAYRNAEIFSNSSVVALNSYGHSITRHSRCVWKHVSAYFQNGTVPGNATCDDMPEMGFGPNYVPVRQQPWLEEDEEWWEESGTDSPFSGLRHRDAFGTRY